VLNTTERVTTSNELGRLLALRRRTVSNKQRYLNHLLCIEALTSKGCGMRCERILRLWHSRRPRLRRIDSTASVRNVVAAAGQLS
jgi:hypothetical protein